MELIASSAETRRSGVVRWIGIALAFVIVACTEPSFLENGAESCSDRVDNDQNGAIDCDDPACATSGVCETTADLCANGRDEDQDGVLDCADSECVAHGFCETFPRTCKPGAMDGCTAGMACFPTASGVTGSGATACSRGGKVGLWEPCTETTECGRGSTCEDGSCQPICSLNLDCPLGSLCVPREGFATCAPPCVPDNPDDPCAVRGECRSLSELRFLYNAEVPLAACVVKKPIAGEVPEGEACNPVSSDTAKRCRAGLVCAPETSASLCRAICAARLFSLSNIEVRCPAGRACTLQSLGVGHPPSSLDVLVTGLCHE